MYEKKINYIYFLYFTQTTPLSPRCCCSSNTFVGGIKQAKISKVYLSKKTRVRQDVINHSLYLYIQTQLLPLPYNVYGDLSFVYLGCVRNRIRRKTVYFTKKTREHTHELLKHIFGKKDKSEYNVNIVWLGVALSHTFSFISFNIVMCTMVSRDIVLRRRDTTSRLTKKINNDLLLNVCYVEIQLQSVWYMSWWWGDLLRNVSVVCVCVLWFSKWIYEEKTRE